MPVSGGVRVMHGTVHEAAHGGKILLVCAVFIEKIPVLDCITLDIPPPRNVVYWRHKQRSAFSGCV